MPLAEVNGVRLYYEVTGKGRPVVFVHGFGCGIRTWDSQVAAFSGAHRVIAYDVRGHGLSDAPTDAAAYSQATSVEDLRQLLDVLRVRRTAVAGLSMGGNIALNFALAHPTRVSALVIADTGAGSDAHADWVATTTRSRRRSTPEGRRPSPTWRWPVRCSRRFAARASRRSASCGRV